MGDGAFEFTMQDAANAVAKLSYARSVSYHESGRNETELRTHEGV